MRAQYSVWLTNESSVLCLIDQWEALLTDLRLRTHWYLSPITIKETVFCPDDDQGITNVFTMVMAAVTACQSWQWYLKMRKYVNTLCLVGLEDKQTTSYFLHCSRRTNVKGSSRLQSLHHLFVSIWTIVAITLNIPTPLNGLTNESRSILLFSIPFHQKGGRSICIPPRLALWIRNPSYNQSRIKSHIKLI